MSHPSSLIPPEPVDPPSDHFALVGRKRLATIFRRHDHVVFVLAGDVLIKQAPRAIARDDDRRPADAAREAPRRFVQTQASFLLVRPVTRIAVLGEDRFDIAGKFDWS